MKNLNKAILIAMGMALPLGAMASPDDDVTIRMMDANEHAADAVTREIELPEMASEHAKEHAAKGLDTANRNRDGEHADNDRHSDHETDDEDHNHDMDRDSDRDQEHDMDREREREHDMEREMEREHEMEREDQRDRDMEMNREDRKDIEHGGMDREEVEREYPDGDHGPDSMDRGNESRMDRDLPDQDNDMSSHDMR